jgi:hypothetical protein
MGALDAGARIVPPPRPPRIDSGQA